MSTNKRKFDISNYSGLISSLVSIACGLIIALLLLVITNPQNAFPAFGTLVTGGMSRTGDIKNIGQALYFTTPILCTGVAMCLAFQAGVFNIGGPGQYTIGAFAAIMTAHALKNVVAAPISWIIPLFSAFFAGALWALIPGLLKAYFNVNVVISTTMFNYIEMYWIKNWVTTYCYDVLKGQSKAIPVSSRMPQGFLKELTHNSAADLGIFIAIAMAIVVWFILEKTKLGYELKACGKNSEASRYAGIASKRNIMISILISGALCGLGGGLAHLSPSGTYITVKEFTAAEGFTGIAVCCLANSNPIAAIAGAFYLAFLTVGGSYMQLFGFQKEIVSVITSVIIYFAAFSLFLRTGIDKFFVKHRMKKEKKLQGGN